MITLVIFDLGGTTVLDRGEIARAFADAMAHAGVEISADQVTSLRGTSKRDAIAALVPDGPGCAGRRHGAYAFFRARLSHAIQAGLVSEVPGATNVFESLRNRGVRVALNTGFDRDMTLAMIDRLGWKAAVDAVVCGDDVLHGRPAPDLIHRAMRETGTTRPAAVANVGDTVADLQAGASAGVAANIGVLTGAHDRMTLEAAPHTLLLSSVREVPAALSGLIPPEARPAG